MKDTHQDVSPKQEAEEPPRRLRERYEVEVSDLTPERMERIVGRIEPGDHVYITKDGRRLAELNWTEHREPLTDAERAAIIEEIRNIPTRKGNPKLKGKVLTREDIYA